MIKSKVYCDICGELIENASFDNRKYLSYPVMSIVEGGLEYTMQNRHIDFHDECISESWVKKFNNSISKQFFDWE